MLSHHSGEMEAEMKEHVGGAPLKSKLMDPLKGPF